MANHPLKGEELIGGDHPKRSRDVIPRRPFSLSSRIRPAEASFLIPPLLPSEDRDRPERLIGEVSGWRSFRHPRQGDVGRRLEDIVAARE